MEITPDDNLREAERCRAEIQPHRTLYEVVRVLDKLSALPALSDASVAFLHELSSSGPLVHWIHKSDRQSFQKEIDICRKSMTGDVLVLNLLADLEAVRELLFHMGFADTTRTAPMTFTQFLQSLELPFIKLSSATQLRSVREHRQEIINILEEVRSGKSCLGVQDLVQDIINHGTFVLRTYSTAHTEWSSRPAMEVVVDKQTVQKRIGEMQLKSLARKLVCTPLQ